MKEPALRRQVLAGLDDHDPEIQRAALRVSLEHFLNDPETAPLVKTAFGKLDNSALNILIEEVGDPKFMRRHVGIAGGAVSQDQQYFLGENLAYLKVPDLLDSPLVLDTVMTCLRAPDANLRAGALDVLRKVKNIEQRPDFRAAINQLEKDSNPRLKFIATSVRDGKKLARRSRTCRPDPCSTSTTLSRRWNPS